MALVYRSICDEVDTVLLQITNLVEKKVKYKVEIEKLMNKGFVSIAKSRYIMGSSCVTKMQFPAESSTPIQPRATVCRAKLNNHWVFHIHRKENSLITGFNDQLDAETGNDFNENTKNNKSVNSVLCNEFNENFSEAPVGANKNDALFQDLLHKDLRSLKKSKDVFIIDDKMYNDFNEEFLDEMSTDSDTSGSLSNLSDPIRLFGILVPNTLKQAQTIFINVVNLLGKCATLQSELKENLDKYNHLNRVKMLITSAAIEMKISLSAPKVYWTPTEDSSSISHLVTHEIDEEEEVEESSQDKISFQKSIRSVFYDLADDKSQECDELSSWSSTIVGDHD